MWRVCSFLCSTPEIPKVEFYNCHRLPRWEFRNGTVVNAQSYDAAVSALKEAYRKNYWAMETIEGQWDVQFEEDVTVEEIHAPDRDEAVRLARMFLDADARHQHLLEKTPRPSAKT